MRNDELARITAACAYVREWAEDGPVPYKARVQRLIEEDVPALLAEVERLRGALQELLAHAPEDDRYVVLDGGGCDVWASDEYEAARRKAQRCLDGVADWEDPP